LVMWGCCRSIRLWGACSQDCRKFRCSCDPRAETLEHRPGRSTPKTCLLQFMRTSDQPGAPAQSQNADLRNPAAPIMHPV
jgi:hypothetical protein